MKDVKFSTLITNPTLDLLFKVVLRNGQSTNVFHYLARYTMSGHLRIQNIAYRDDKHVFIADVKQELEAEGCHYDGTVCKRHLIAAFERKCIAVRYPGFNQYEGDSYRITPYIVFKGHFKAAKVLKVTAFDNNRLKEKAWGLHCLGDERSLRTVTPEEWPLFNLLED